MIVLLRVGGLDSDNDTCTPKPLKPCKHGVCSRAAARKLEGTVAYQALRLNSAQARNPSVQPESVVGLKASK